MAERLRTEGVGRGVNWAGMSNLANIIQRGGETQAEIYKGIGETIGRKIRDQQELSLEREKLSQQSGIQARQMALQEAQYGLDLQKYQFDVARADTEISNKVSTDKLNSLVKLAEQARESGDQQFGASRPRGRNADEQARGRDDAVVRAHDGGTQPAGVVGAVLFGLGDVQCCAPRCLLSGTCRYSQPRRRK